MPTSRRPDATTVPERPPLLRKVIPERDADPPPVARWLRRLPAERRRGDLRREDRFVERVEEGQPRAVSRLGFPRTVGARRRLGGRSGCGMEVTQPDQNHGEADSKMIP